MAHMFKIDPEEIELNKIKQVIRMRYDQNKEFIPIEEVFEMILEFNKYYHAQNKELTRMLEDTLKYSIRPIIYETSNICTRDRNHEGPCNGFPGADCICQPLDKK